MMKIHVNRVPEEGLRERAVYDPSAMDMDRADLHLREPVEAELFIAKADQALYAAKRAGRNRVEAAP